MGQCTIAVISGCRRKRRKSRSSGSEETERNSSSKGRAPATSSVQRHCLLLVFAILLFSPGAIRGSSLGPNNGEGVAPRTPILVTERGSSSTSEIAEPNSTASTLLSSSEASRSTPTVLLSATTTTYSGLSSIATEQVSAKYYLSSSTPVDRVIRSTSRGAAVTEPIRVTASVPDHHRGHRNHNSHHEDVHSTKNSRPQQQAKTPPTLQEICTAWEEKGCKCSGSTEEIQLNCHAVSFDGLPLDLPDNLVKL